MRGTVFAHEKQASRGAVMKQDFSLEHHGIEGVEIRRNPSPSTLYQAALLEEGRSAIAGSGALIAYSGARTGRSPADKRVVRHAESADEIWWGDVNIKIGDESFAINRERAVDYLNTCDTLYCVDGAVCWDPKYRLKVRVICARPYHALFMHNMMIRLSDEELEAFGEPDFVILNAGGFSASRVTSGVESRTSVQLNLERGEMVILGTEYAGEMKKGIFTVVNYRGPAAGVLTMHCSATEGRHGDTSLLFGLSGTGKTTLSADPKRRLIGDDEHGWSERGIFNLEGGCYAKVIDLSAESEPEIHAAIRFGAVLENVVFDPDTGAVDYGDRTLTENTRAAYPIEFMARAKIPCVGDHPRNVIFLTCDAFGVLPPVSRLTPEQAMYHFISGYSAKVAGTEEGVDEPKAVFSPCFGGPFLARHPTEYAELLAERIRAHEAQTWLVNTGWTSGGYGVGSRVDLAHTRAMLDAIHSGALLDVETARDPSFGLEVPTSCPDVPPEILIPRNTWDDKDAYDETAEKLLALFQENFRQYEDVAPPEVVRAAPGGDR
jgi:phosphoenolpyruvate carboxykinase (ATP)